MKRRVDQRVEHQPRPARARLIARGNVLQNTSDLERHGSALLRSRVCASARTYFSSHGVNSSSISPSDGGRRPQGRRDPVRLNHTSKALIEGAVPGGHRSVLSPCSSGRRDEVCRNGAEDWKRRAHSEQQRRNLSRPRRIACCSGEGGQFVCDARTQMFATSFRGVLD